MIFGVTDDLSFCGATTRLDSKLINDQIRRYLGDRIWVEFHREFIQEDQRYLGVALVPRVIELLTPLRTHPSAKTRRLTLPLLLNAYERMGDIVNASGIKVEIEESQL